MRTEYYYTCKGRQRAVFFGPDVAGARFSVELDGGDDATVEVSYEPLEQVRKGRARWEVFDGGLGGSVQGASALRLNVGRVDGWLKLVVERS
jgi:hypothetical protein